MYEICALLSSPKPKKSKRKTINKKKSISVGKKCLINGHECIITRKDDRYPPPYNAWYVSLNGEELKYSFSRDMIEVI